MKFKVIVTLEGLTDLQGEPLKASFEVETNSLEEAKNEGLMLWELSTPKVDAFPLEEEPDYS